MASENKISVPSVRIVESLSRSLHAAEMSLVQVRDEVERACVAKLIFEMKTLIGGFFRAHVDRREKDRGTSPIADYEGYFLGKKTPPNVARPTCPFCESARVAFRRKGQSGDTYWYCTSCRQEFRI